MHLLKKTILSILALSSTTVFSGTMGTACTNGLVALPCEKSAWELSIDALYLRPAYSNPTYLTHFTNTAGLTHWQKLDPSWDWGFKLAGAYHFNTGSDLNLNWYHYNQTTTRTIAVGTAGAPIATTTLLNPKWDAVNAEFGQRVDFGQLKHIRFHGGAQYVQITNNFTDNATGYSPEQLYIKLNGFGPRLGADMSYDWGHGVALYANGATALLVGDSKFNTTTSGIIDNPGASYSSATVVIPELEGKLGAKYTYALTQGDVSLDIGYMWLNYINSQSFLTVNGLGGTTDFSLSGPYVGLKWLGSM